MGAQAVQSVAHLVERVRQLSPSSLRAFRRQLGAWGRENGSDPVDDFFVEAARARLPEGVERRLKRLINKSERGILTATELAEYRTLAQRAEQIDVMRAAAMAELCQRRGKQATSGIVDTSAEDATDGS